MTSRLADLPRSASILYGINTMGAVIGTLVAGYFLLPLIGMRNTLFAGAVLDLVVAVVIFAVCRNTDQTTDRKVEKPAWLDEHVAGATTSRLILVFFACSGFAALTYQITWIRALTLVLGSSVYSFTTTLAVFLTGLGLGSLLYRRLPGGSHHNARLNQAAVITIATGFASSLGLWLIGHLPETFLWGYHRGWGGHFAIFQLFTFFMCFLVMIVPTFLLGSMFPLMANIWTRSDASIGRDVGMVYAANTAGCIAGAMTAGLLLLPFLGVHGAMMLAAGLHVLAGIGFMWINRDSTARRLVATSGVAAIFVAIIWFVPPWDRAVMTSGVYNYADIMTGSTASERLLGRVRSFTMLFYKDGRDGTVNVLEKDGQRMLAINGKIDASTQSDLPTQIMVGQLPMMVHPHPRKVLIIGLGSGITAGAVALNDDVEEIDIIEISPEVVEAAKFFSEANRHILEDPRVHLVIADARNYLLATDRRYDVIVSEPSNPWISGISNLFTLDFFQLLQNRLAPGGLIAQWFHIYNMPPDNIRSVLKSFRSVFPDVSAWLSLNIDMILLGSQEPHALDADRIELALERPETLAKMTEIGMNNAGSIAKMFVFRGDELMSYCDGASLNTDDCPLVEFSAPRYLYKNTTEGTLKGIVEHLAGSPAEVPMTNVAKIAGSKLVMTTADIAVSTSNDMAPPEWKSGYRVIRKLFPSQNGDGVEMLGVGSHGWFSWNDGSTRNRVRAMHLDAARTIEQLTQFLREEIRNPLLAGGEVDLPGGSRGAWLLSRLDQEKSRVTVSISWCAPSRHGGFFQYVAGRDLDDPGEKEWGPALVAFARCFVPLGLKISP
jgi:spermidine synthase